MRNTTNDLSQTLRLLLRRAAIVTALSLVGVFGAQAADTTTISLSEEICLACAYENGLPGLAAPAPEAAAPAAAELDEAPSPFDRARTDRARISLPSSAGNRGERLLWSRGEKVLLWSFVSLSAVDAYQTMNAPAHVVEANPLLASWAGDHPSGFETVAFKTATAYGMYHLAGRIKNRGTRRVALALMNVIQLSVVAHNEQVTGGSF